jgi:hypothetical protein
LSGPTVSVQSPSASFSKGTGVLPLPIASRIGPPVKATVRASGAFSRKVTVRSSLTSGEIRLAPYGASPWVFLCGFQSRLTWACWADAATEPPAIASTTKSVVFMDADSSSPW